MKRLFFIFNLMLLVASQLVGKSLNDDYPPYEPMVVEGYSWNIVSVGDGGNPGQLIYCTDTEIIEGDSIINGVKYKKLWKAYNTDLDKKHFLTLIREDYRKRKVYAYNNGIEAVLYDFGWYNIGDTIKVIKGLRSLKYINSNNTNESEDAFTYLVIDNMEKVKIDNLNLLDKITYHVSGKDYIKGVFYERFGNLSGWAHNNHEELDGGPFIQALICAFDADGNLVFKPKHGEEKIDNIENCYINETINTNTATINDAQQNIYYNSQEKVLYVDVESEKSIVIYDTMGKVVMTKKVDANTKSIAMDLNAGIYIVGFKGENRYSKVVVK